MASRNPPWCLNHAPAPRILLQLCFCPPWVARVTQCLRAPVVQWTPKALQSNIDTAGVGKTAASCYHLLPVWHQIEHARVQHPVAWSKQVAQPDKTDTSWSGARWSHGCTPREGLCIGTPIAGVGSTYGAAIIVRSGTFCAGAECGAARAERTQGAAGSRHRSPARKHAIFITLLATVLCKSLILVPICTTLSGLTPFSAC
jgi:hypothetical protein